MIQLSFDLLKKLFYEVEETENFVFSPYHSTLLVVLIQIYSKGQTQKKLMVLLNQDYSLIKGNEDNEGKNNLLYFLRSLSLASKIFCTLEIGIIHGPRLLRDIDEKLLKIFNINLKELGNWKRNDLSESLTEIDRELEFMNLKTKNYSCLIKSLPKIVLYGKCEIKINWKHKFRKCSEKNIFWGYGYDKVNIDMYHQQSTCKYYDREDRSFRICILESGSKMYLVMFVLPTKGENIEKIMKSFSTMKLINILDTASEELIDIYLPNPTLNSVCDLQSLLQKLDVELTGIDFAHPEESDNFNHHDCGFYSYSKLDWGLDDSDLIENDINNNSNSSNKAIEFIIDRPYGFFIVDNITNLVSATGVVRHPTQI